MNSTKAERSTKAEPVYRVPAYGIVCSGGSHHRIYADDYDGAGLVTTGKCNCNIYNNGEPITFPSYNRDGHTETFERKIAHWREWVLARKGLDHERKVDRMINNLRSRYLNGTVRSWVPRYGFTGEPLCKSEGHPEGEETWSPDCECTQCDLKCE